MSTLRVSSLLALLLIPACADDSPEPSDPPRADGGAMLPVGASDDCERGTIEDDLQAAPLSGSAVQDGALAKGQYLVATTYLRMQPNRRALLIELTSPVIADAAQREGLMGMTFGTSAACNSARTLTVWRDEEAMLDFVVGPTHARVMAQTSQISRGGSLGTHWTGDETSANWEAAADHLAEEDREGF